MRQSVRFVQVLAVCFALASSGVYSVGPVAQAADTGTSKQLPLYGGSITSLAINLLAPTTLYAGANPGGIFRSTNSGDSWTAVNTGVSDSQVYSLAINPLVPTTLYAGTREGGVFRSTDSGDSWTPVNNGLAAPWVCALCIHPSTPTTLYAGTREGGVFRSTDSGDSWTPVNTGITNLNIRSLAIDPLVPSTLYAGTARGLFRSTDSGDSWITANTGLTEPPACDALAIDPVTPSTLYVGNQSHVFRSTDGGAIWTEVEPGLGSYGVQSLAIDPLAPAIVYVATDGTGIFRRIAVSDSWTPVNTGFDNPHVYSLAINPLVPTTLYAGTDASGVFRSTDSGDNWTAVNNGLAAQVVPCLAINPLVPSTLYAGTASRYADIGGSSSGVRGGGVFRSTDSGDNWTAVNNGLIHATVMDLVIDPLTPTTVYAGTSGFGVFRSSDSGDNWIAVNVGLTTQYVGSLAINPLVPTTIYASTRLSNLTGGIFRSTDSGGSWTAVNNGLTNRYVYCLAINPLVPTTLYAGTYLSGSDGGVYRSIDSGDTWTEINTGLTSRYVICLAISPLVPATLYAGTLDGGVFRSTDSGDNWTVVNAGLANPSVYSLAIDPAVPATLYAGTNGGGVFSSTTGGDSWTAVTDFPVARIQSVALDPVSPSTLYVGTWGRGVFRTSYSLTTTTSPSIGGAIAKFPSQTIYTPGTSVTLTATPALGWHFTGWSGDLTGTANPTTVTMDANKTVTATFAIDTHTLSTGQIGSGSVSKNPSQATYDYGAVVDLTATPDPGWHFVSWSGDLTGSANPATITLDADKTVIASFAAKVGAVTISSGGNGTVTPIAPVSQTYGATGASIAATPVTGYHFVSWSATLNPTYVSIADPTLASTTFTTTSSMPDGGTALITANFAINTYSLMTNVVGSGSVARSPDVGLYDHGASVQLTATPVLGWHFVNWSGDLTGATNPATITMDADKTATATFAINTHVVTVTVGPNGKVVPGTGPVPHHATRVFNVNPDAGYVIDRVILDGVIQTDAAGRRSYVVTLRQVEGAHTLSATFRPVPDVRPPTITLPDLSKTPGIVGWSGGAVPTFTVGASPFHLTFTLEDDGGTVKWTITVNGTVIVDPVDTGSITYPIPLTEGRNDVEVSASDVAGNYTNQKLVIYLDSVGPVLDINPALPVSVTKPQLTVTGSAVDGVSGLKSLTIDGTPVVPFLDGSFRETLLLSKGVNSIVIEAEDRVGHRVSVTYPVTYAATLPPALTATTVTLTIGTAEMDVDGMPVTLDAAPIIQNSRTLLPIRAIVEAFGGTIEWFADLRAVTMYLNGRQVSLQIGNPRGFVDGVQKPLDAADPKIVPIIISGRTFLPLRFVAENLGLQVTWDASARTATVSISTVE